MGLERWVLLLQLGLSWDPLQPRMALIPDASHYASAVPWSVLCLALFLITFINVLQTTIWRTVKKLRGGGGGATDFMVLTGQCPVFGVGKHVLGLLGLPGR